MPVHPFTIANSADFIPETQANRGLTLYSKKCGDWTASLYEAAGSDSSRSSLRFVDDKNGSLASGSSTPTLPNELQRADVEEVQISVAVDGPYGNSCPSLEDAEVAMLVAGGSGVTCVLNALEEIIANSADGRCALSRVRVVYVLRGLERNRYFVDLLGELARTAASKTPLMLDVLVYDSSSIVPDAGWTFGGKDGAPSTSLSLHAGRPDLLSLLDQLLAEQQGTSPGSGIGGGAVVLSCGPASLVSAVSTSPHPSCALRTAGPRLMSALCLGDSEVPACRFQVSTGFGLSSVSALSCVCETSAYADHAYLQWRHLGPLRDVWLVRAGLRSCGE